MSSFREYEAIYTELETLLPKRGNGTLKRVLRWGKNVYNASSVKSKIVKQQKRVHDAQLQFLVRYSMQFSVSLYSIYVLHR